MVRENEAFDHRFRERFLDLHLEAAVRRRDSWLTSARGALALVILSDQFPRNVFRYRPYVCVRSSGPALCAACIGRWVHGAG
ncbi:TPA: DUF924 family protein [Pseudomonas aeruginosa]|nr:DUF924 family protein [Pseudomonas aeruginosa]